MPKLGKLFCLLATVALWQGCSSTSDNGDAATTSDTAADVPSVFLSRGMNNYVVTQVSGVTDGCAINPNGIKNMTLLVNFVESTRMLSVGTLVGTPLQAALGTGVVAGTTGTLNRENDVTDGACVWHQKNVSNFTLTGGDVFTLEVTETQSAFTAPCAAANPTCTSLYTFTFGNPTPI
jgi:hypothetical protein